MPRGNPKRRVNLRVDPALLEAANLLGYRDTEAVEEGLRLLVERGAQKPALSKSGDVSD